MSDQRKDPLIGTTFAEQYEILSVLGTGGMSVVYRAKHKLMDRIVALKLLHGQTDPLALERFKQEAKAASSLNHPNIITVYEFGIVGQQAFLVMDCLEGPNLGEVLQEHRRISVDRAVRIFRQTCMGLEHAHKKGIVHRDLKPSNLCLVTGDDGAEMVKIVDFGIAKLLGQTGKQQIQLTQTGEIFGSPMYMSPEQCMAQPLDTRSDIYSLGCVMYESLTGAAPLLGETAYETMTMHVNTTPHSFSKVAPDVQIDKSVEAIVFRCLEKKPDERYQSVSEILADLPIIKPESGSLKVKIVQHPTKQKREMKMLRYGFYSLSIVVLALFTYMALDHGPDNDKGTVLQKTIWNAQTTMAQSMINSQNWAGAKEMLLITEHTARTRFSNPGRLMTALVLQRQLYKKARMFEELDAANKKIAALNQKILNENYLQMMKEVGDLSKNDTPVVTSVNKIMAPIVYSSIAHVAKNLAGNNMDLQEQSLLEQAKKVYVNLLGLDDTLVADIDMLLADCYSRQQMLPQVRPLLLEAMEIYQKKVGSNDARTVLAIMSLGQLDRDEDKYQQAKVELEQALAQAEKSLSSDKGLLATCMRSYASYLAQTGDNKRSADLFAKATELSKEAQASVSSD